MQPLDTSIICPLNDAESFTILRIAKSLGYEARVSVQNSWFCPLDREPPYTFLNLRENVIIVEMPGPQQEELLRQEHDVIVIDHHDYASLDLHRDHSKSSLEQFAFLAGYRLSREDTAVAVNDQRYIYGLIEEGFSCEEIRRVRRLDLFLQGYVEADFHTSEEDIQNKTTFANGVTLYHSSLREKFSYLLDLHVLERDGKRSNVVIIGPACDDKGTYIYFSGDTDLVERLKLLGGYSKKSSPAYGLWGGFERGRESVDLAKALDIIRMYS
ncbi:MAG: hypothetical protein PHX93_06230 [Candidatus Peribacteraceae bacterium]|jgi:hypothetical protein|nr:hypothetical protein [Candidatus Peribacteraceae bacterium]